jgi:magnesium transporter
MDDAMMQAQKVNGVKYASSFCVAQRPSGTVDKFSDQSVEQYLSCIQDANVAWIDYTAKDLEKDVERVAALMGFTQVPIQKLLTGFYSGYEDADTELGIMVPAVLVVNGEMVARPLIILIRSNFVVTIHHEEIVRLLKFSRYAQQFLKKIKEEKAEDKITLILERIIDENNDRNFEYLRQIEKHGDDISRNLIDDSMIKAQVARDIYSMKHILIEYLNILWATKDVIESLRYGDADLITDDEKILLRVGILSTNIDRHIELSEQMSHVLSSGLEVMQSIYNNQLQTMNNRFALVTAYLTVLGTAFLVPNTIATVAGSGVMHGRMGAQWWYIPLLLASTIVATIVSFIWVVVVWKRKTPI